LLTKELIISIVAARFLVSAEPLVLWFSAALPEVGGSPDSTQKYREGFIHAKNFRSTSTQYQRAA
jgi:hypothetical protein